MSQQKRQRFEAILERLPESERCELLDLCIGLARYFLSQWRKRQRRKNSRDATHSPDLHP